MKIRLYLLALFSTLILSFLAPVSAQTPNATLTITDIANGGGTYNYSLNLTDTGTTNIGAFWFSWIPGQSYMTNPVTNITSPTGWASSIVVTPGGGELGGSVEWGTSTNFLTPGASITFGFTSLETPAQISGFSGFGPYAGISEATSTIYSGAVLASPSATIVGSVVPEPASYTLVVVGIAFVIAARRRLA